MSLPELDPIVVGATLNSPDVTQLTTKSITGTGVFDVLMHTVKLHLNEEYKADRISGAQYSDVYMGALTAVLQQSVTFILNHQSEEKVVAEIGLIRQQTVTELASTCDSIPLALAFNDTSAVQGLIKAKLAIDALQADLVEMQVANSKAERDLLGQKVITELASTSDVLTEAIDAGYGYNTAADVQGLLATEKAKTVKAGELIDSQIDTAAAEKALLGQKIISELANTSTNISLAKSHHGYNSEDTITTGLIAMQAAKIAKDADLVDSQITASDLEGHLVGQKIVTELSQTGDDLTNVKLANFGYNVESAISGLIKSQKDKVIKEGLFVDSQIESAVAEKALTGQKIVTELANTGDSLADVPEIYGYNHETSVAGLIKLQKDKVTQEGLLVTSQVTASDLEGHLVGQKIVTELAQTGDDITKVKTANFGYNVETAVAGVTGMTRAKIQKEGLLIDSNIQSAVAEGQLIGQKIVTELAQTDDDLTKAILLGYNTNTTLMGVIGMTREKLQNEADLIEVQKLSAEAEKSLTGQKLITELAQTDDSLTMAKAAGFGYNSTTTVEGMVALEKAKVTKSSALIDAQIDSSGTEKLLTEQKVITELAQTTNDLSKARGYLIGQNNNDEVGGLIATQTAKVLKEGLLVDSQIAASDLEGHLVSQKIITELSQTGDDLTKAKLAEFGFNVEPVVLGVIGMTRAKIEKEGELIDSNILSAVAEGNLIGQKIVTELAQTDDDLTKAKEASYGYNTNITLKGVIGMTKDKIKNEADLIAVQKLTADAEKALMGQKVISELAQTAVDVSNALTKGYGYNVDSTIKGLAAESAAKSQHESRLTEQKIVTELAQTSDTIPTDLGYNMSNLMSGIALSTRKKTDAEVLLLSQKVTTELAQTSDSIVTGQGNLNTSSVVTGIIEEQKKLFNQQTEGFKRDAEQKLAKIYVDAWSITATTADSDRNISNLLEDGNLGQIMAIAKAGITV